MSMLLERQQIQALTAKMADALTKDERRMLADHLISYALDYDPDSHTASLERDQRLCNFLYSALNAYLLAGPRG